MANTSSLRILDSRGRAIPKSFLYDSPQRKPGQYKQRWMGNLVDYDKEITISTRTELLQYSRQIFAQMGNINNAICQKAQFSCGSEWRPVFNGEDKDWGDEVIEWLQNNWYPIADVRGFDFRSCLKMASINMDIDGDILMVFTNAKSGYPLVQFIESHRIGQRYNSGQSVVKDGKYRGLTIENGVIKNDNGRPIAYRILGNKEDEDVDISARNCKMLCEGIHFSQTRGIPKLASCILDSLDIQDIDDFLKQAIKIESRISLVRKNANGEANIADGNIIVDSQTVDEGAEPTEPTLPNLEIMRGGEVLYIDNESDILPFESSRPSPNTIDFIRRIEERMYDSIGYSLYHLEDKGGASVRAVQEMFRSTILTRQETIEIAAKQAILFAITNGMQLGLISQNNDSDWFKWSFTYPALYTVDQGNQSASDINEYRLGIQTLDDLTTKLGKRWKDVRSQAQMEVDDLLDRATATSKKYDITIDAAINLLSMRGPNMPQTLGQVLPTAIKNPQKLAEPLQG